MKRKRTRKALTFRIDPSTRMCPNFDESSMAMFPTAQYDEMGVVVQDDCAQEHIQ